MPTSVSDRHIEITSAIAGGKARIAGRRITVQQIVVWHERLGKNIDEIADEHDLSLGDIHAALAYYFDHQPEIDQGIEQEKAFVASLRSTTPSRLRSRRSARELHV